MRDEEFKIEAKQFLTVPNLLTLFRILLIPLIVSEYVYKENYLRAAVILILSGLTDVLDGWIARNFNQVSDLGKILDPVADKLTQAVVLLCLTTRFSPLKKLLILFVIKEAIAALSGLYVLHRTGYPLSSDWHGKAITFMLYVILFLHMFWPSIPPVLTHTLVYATMGFMLMSLVLYTIRNVRQIKAFETGDLSEEAFRLRHKKTRTN